MSSLMETESLSDTKVGTLWQLSDIMEHGICGSKIDVQLYSTFVLSFIVTQLLSEGLKNNWITITAYFRNGKFPDANLDFWWLTFWHNYS